MFAKRSSRALALLLALPSAAFALGLGDIHLLSPLNAPLDAEIELVDVAPDEINSVQVQLASRETFAKYGLEFPPFLNGVQLKTQRTSDGREVIKLKSTEAISEPFVTLLVEVNWARGRLVREYTMLLDPPVYAPNGSAVASAPVTAPATSAPGAREGSIARAAEAPAPEAAPVPPEATAQPAPTAPAAAPARRSHAAAAAAPGAASEPAEGEGGSHTVQRGETLSAIAAGVAGAKVTSARARSWMVAIYNANPEAFRKNMNVMRSGAVLRIPDASAADAISASEANAEIHRQYTAWRGAAGEATPAPAEQPGRLKLVTPSGPAAANATPPAPAASAKEAAAAAAAAAAASAQAAKDAEAKRLLELKNEELARMQAQNAAKQAPAAAPAPAPAPAATAPAATAPAATEPPPAPPAEQAPPEVQAAPAPVAKPKPVPPVAAPAGPSFLDSLLSYWWYILGAIAIGILGVLAARVWRSKRATAELDDSLGRMAAAGAESAELGNMTATRGFSDPDAAPVPVPTPRMSAAAVPDSFVVEETGSHERPRLSVTGQMPAISTPKHVASDETISSETAINLDQGDPLAEADFHMAYGLYDQAADLIRIAISREPARRDLKLKLLEVFFVWGNKEQFLSSARELAQSREDAAPGEWEKILIMGKQLAPEDPLFSGGGAISGASAGGVDLDLEGGQSRVDFDLIGDEPVPGEARHGVDLDIGSAVGDLDATAESQSGITDRNAALLEGSFLGGTTRQMTGRMRTPGGATAEMEGPTVEQPQLTPPDNPTIRQKLESAMRKVGTEHTAELAIDDLGLDVGSIDTVDQPGITSVAASTPDAPTLVAGLDEGSRRVMEDAHRRAREETGSTTGAWQFDQGELEAALTQTSQMLPDASATSRMRALSGHDLDVDVGDATGQHMAHGDVDLDVGIATGTHETHGGTLDLDVGTATVPDAAFAATQRLASDDLALPDLEPVTMSEVGTKLDLARAYMDMGDPDGARNILEEVLGEGSAAQKQEAQRLIESLPG